MSTLAAVGQPVTQPQQPQVGVNAQKPAGQFEEGKIFVGGLLNATKKESLKNYFEKFGETTEVQIMVDPVTDRSRGFGFVTFKDSATVQAVLDSKPHTIDGKIVDPKPAVMKGVDVAPTGLLIHATKIFIGGVPQGTLKDDVEKYFSQYGKVVEIDLKHDRYTQRMRGFGFVGFDNEESARKAAETPFHSINGKTIEVKPAEPRGKTPGMGRGGFTPQQVYPPQQGVYPEYPNHPQYNYRPSNGYSGGGYGPGAYSYPPPPSYPQYNYPPNGPAAYSHQYSNQDYSSYNYGRAQSSYGQDNGYGHRGGGYGTSATEAYSGGTTYNSYPEQTSQYAAYSDPTSGTANYGRGTSQQRFTPGYSNR